jgi:hypothetical protein
MISDKNTSVMSKSILKSLQLKLYEKERLIERERQRAKYDKEK